MIIRIQQSQPSQNTFGTKVHKSLKGILSEALINELENDRRGRTLLLKSNDNVDVLVIKRKQKETVVGYTLKSATADAWNNYLKLSSKFLDKIENFPAL